MENIQDLPAQPETTTPNAIATQVEAVSEVATVEPPAPKKTAAKKDTQRATAAPDLETLAAQLDALAEVVASGSATIVTAPQKKTAADLPVFEHNGIAYRFRVHGFSFDGTTTYNSAEVVQDEALIGKIVTEYPGLIARSE